MITIALSKSQHSLMAHITALLNRKGEEYGDHLFDQLKDVEQTLASRLRDIDLDCIDLDRITSALGDRQSLKQDSDRVAVNTQTAAELAMKLSRLFDRLAAPSSEVLPGIRLFRVAGGVPRVGANN